MFIEFSNILLVWGGNGTGVSKKILLRFTGLQLTSNEIGRYFFFKLSLLRIHELIAVFSSIHLRFDEISFVEIMIVHT